MVNLKQGHGDERQCKTPSLVKLLSGIGRVVQVSASYGQSMVILLPHHQDATSLARTLHSAPAVVQQKVHGDLVAEAAPNLASIRTLLATKEPAHQARPLYELS